MREATPLPQQPINASAHAHNAQGLRMRDDGDALSDGFAEAHWDSTRLPEPQRRRLI